MWNPWTGPSTPDAVAIVVLSCNGAASAAAARIQRRFRMLACVTLTAEKLCKSGFPVKSDEDRFLVTAWDVGNAEGDKLDKPIMGALRLLIGADAPPAPNSIRSASPLGTVVAGPLISAALATAIVPADPEPPAPDAKGITAEAKTKGNKTSGGEKVVQAAGVGERPSKPKGPRKLSLEIVKGTNGRKVDVILTRIDAPRRPLVAVELQRPTKQGGDWVNIRVLPPAAASPAAGGTSKGGSSTAKPKSSAAPKATAQAIVTSGSADANHAGDASGGGDAKSDGSQVGCGPVGPTYRATRDASAMQPALRQAAAGRAEMAYVFHGGKVPWQDAVAIGARH